MLLGSNELRPELLLTILEYKGELSTTKNHAVQNVSNGKIEKS